VDLEKSPLFNESPPSFCKDKNFNTTALFNEYNTSDHKQKTIKDNFFEKMKPLMRSWKNNSKFKKTEHKDQSTSMDGNMTILPDFDKYQNLSPSIPTELVRKFKLI
jgi:hypothetical protein